VQKLLVQANIQDKPDALKIPFMTEAERQELAEYWKTMPALSEGPLLRLDLEGILKDPAWNPTGRDLDPEERARATKLLQDYYYFTRVSQVERFKTLVEPKIAHFLEIGAFIEYDQKDGGPPFDGFTITHAETDGSGRFRKYYFPQDEYPEMYHHRQVCQERAQETFANLYRLLSRN